MTLLALKYSKVTNYALEKLSSCFSEIEIKFADLQKFGDRIDMLGFSEVSSFLTKEEPFDAVMIGDIFWPTGQRICQWCDTNNINCYFLQHGQWIYVNNKKNPRCLPHRTLFLGDNVKKMCDSWPYGKRSLLEVTGCPRYDYCERNEGDEGFVYFSPPVMLELNVSSAPIRHLRSEIVLEQLSGIDKQVHLKIHPHYREGQIDRLRDMFTEAEFIDSSDDPLDHIPKSSKVLTHRNSTVVLDAIACGKISVLINFLDTLQSQFRRHYFEGFALESRSVAKCSEYLKPSKPLNTKDYVSRARPHIYLGSASNRIEKLLLREMYN